MSAVTTRRSDVEMADDTAVEDSEKPAVDTKDACVFLVLSTF
jgi:hypothetical protein